MQDRGLSEFLSFSGHLQGDGGTAEVSFRARVNQSGEVEFDFGTIQVTHAIRFVSRSWDQPGPKPVYFSLIGNTEDDITLETSHLHFSTLNEQWSRDTGRQISPVGSSLRTVFRRKMAAPAAKPVLRMHLKGFRNFGPLRVRCPLGTIATGATPVPDPDIMTGIIEVVPDDAPADLFAWRSQADKLLEHVRRVMSLAAAAVLRVPIVEFYNGVECRVIALSQSPQSAGSMRTFRYLQQQPIFEAAVDSFFRPPIDAKNLSLQSNGSRPG